MNEDELLREASDPTIGAERLHALWEATWRMQERRVVFVALLRNPSIDERTLRHWLDEWQAWENPLIPALILADPSMREAAAVALYEEAHTTIMPDDDYPQDLDEQVTLWAAHVPRDPQEEHVRAFARHLAGLFGLPWPEEP
jgi:hypothetical protein